MPDYQYERTPAQVRRGYKLVRVRVASLDRALAADPGFHVGPGGVGPSAIKGRYPQARDFLAAATKAGTRVHAPEGGVDRAGRPYLDDGRHRFAAIRDSGAETVEIAVPRGQANRFGRLFGGEAGPADRGRKAGFNQPLAGRIEPRVQSWSDAVPADRLAFYKRAGELAVEQKRAELARAIGINGRRMKPRKHPRPDGANGPVLTPHREASRTARLLDARATATGVTLYWHAGLGKTTHSTPWGTILGFHAAGQVRGAPVRDVRLSTRGINKVRGEMARWWAARVGAEERATAKRESRRRAATAAKPGRFSRAQKALVDKYSMLKDYFRPKGGGI